MTPEHERGLREQRRQRYFRGAIVVALLAAAVFFTEGGTLLRGALVVAAIAAGIWASWAA